MKRSNLKRHPTKVKHSKPKRPKLIKKLDLLLGALIRNRDERMPCIDLCGRTGKHQAGHFRRRKLMATRFDPQNVNGQNEYCNAFDNDGFRHAKGIDERWDEGTADELDLKSRETKQWTIPELEELILAAQTGYAEYWTTYYKLFPK
jgi:hypothetical protein